MNDQQAWFGGELVTVTFRKQHPNGVETAPETVKVRELDLDDYPRYAAALDDERASIELFCDKPAGWAKTLTPKSHNELIEKGQALNLPFFGPWLHRKLKREGALVAGLSQEEKDVVATLARMQAGPSPASSPK